MPCSARPTIPTCSRPRGLNRAKVQTASGPVWSDQHGRARGIYRQQCGHCHGTTGDGDGPTAALLNPYPRDYRRGLFKFKSTERAAQADRCRPGAGHSLRGAGHGHAGLRSVARGRSRRAGRICEVSEHPRPDRICPGGGHQRSERRRRRCRPTIRPWSRSILQPIAEKWQQANKADHPAAGQARRRDWPSRSPRDASCSTAPRPTASSATARSELGDGQTTDYDDWTKPLVEYAKEVAKDCTAFPAIPT